MQNGIMLTISSSLSYVHANYDNASFNRYCCSLNLRSGCFHFFCGTSTEWAYIFDAEYIQITIYYERTFLYLLVRLWFLTILPQSGQLTMPNAFGSPQEL